MSRTDRLMALVQRLRSGATHRAEDLAREAGVSVRTIYRDIETLAASGVPVSGTPGVGYQVADTLTLPPLNLTLTEVEALHLGLSAVGERGDADLSQAARSLSAKLDAVMPEDRRAAPAGYGFAVYPFADAARGFQHLPKIRQAIRARQKLRLSTGGAARSVRPLRLEYWGRLWTCLVWDETAAGFEDLRVDRITELRVMPQLFVEEPGKTLADYQASQSPGSVSSGRK